MNNTITFGEIMGRLCPVGCDRFRQAMPGRLGITFAGAEANVAVALAQLGGQASFVSALPENPIADACVANLKSHGVDVSGIQRFQEGRLGLYFVERGANQRPSRVIYDRDHSCIALTSPEAYPWDEIFKEAGWFHFTGITPALSERAAASCLAAVRKAKAGGATISCDLNFRAKLWRWDSQKKPRDLAAQVMRELLPFVDVLIANEADASDVLGIEAGDVESGNLELERYPEVASKIVEEFPSIQKVAITLRESHSASHNDWGGMLFEAKEKRAYFGPVDHGGSYRPYEIRQIVDRVGAGDSFAGALIYALQTADLSNPEKAVSFAAAASCLAHSIEGDFNLNLRSEVEALMNGSGSGRVVR